MSSNIIVEGEKAPDFTLPDKDDKPWPLKELLGDYTVLFFYPKDNTPGCTIEATTFNKDLKKFEALKTSIVGISGGDAKSKTKFCEQHGLTITLLSDSDFSVCQSYGVYGKKSFMGKEHMGIFRTTFILDKGGNVLKVFESVKPEGHSEEVLEFIGESR